jgi:hypothetical protein
MRIHNFITITTRKGSLYCLFFHFFWKAVMVRDRGSQTGVFMVADVRHLVRGV